MGRVLLRKLWCSRGSSTRGSVVPRAWAVIPFILWFLGIAAWPHPAGALSSTPNPDTWITDGQVNTIVTDGTTVYLGGSFTYVGPNTGSGVPIDASNGSPEAVYPKVNGEVSAVVPDGSGGWYIGGYFTRVGSLARNHIAHILSNGTVDPAWDPNVNGYFVRALAVSGTPAATVYAGGNFSSVGSDSRNYLAAVDAVTGHVTSWNPDPNNQVETIEVSGSTVYIGGGFTRLGITGHGVPLNAATGAPLATYPKVDGTVFAVVPDGAGGWYIGGSFSQVGGLVRNNIAHILSDGTVDASWNPNANAGVRALAVSGLTVYAAGEFSNIGGQTRNRIAALDAATGLATSWNPDSNGGVEALALSGSTVYVGGYFNFIGGEDRNFIAAIDASTGLATTWNPNAAGWVNTLALAVDGSKVYAGGMFSSIGGETRNLIAAIDAGTGLATAWNPNANYQVVTLAVSESTVYAGGGFTSIGGQTRNYVAAIDATTGSAISWNPDANERVEALAVSGSTVYAGGHFTSIGGETRNHIAAINAGTGLATAWDPDADDFVYALASSGSTVYAGGEFNYIGTPVRNRIAAIDAATGQIAVWNPNANDPVFTLAASGSTVYAGGRFTSIGGQARSRIAAIDAATGNATGWNPSANSEVSILRVSGPTVYAGGEFTSIGGQPRNNIAALEVATGLATAWNPNANYGVSDLAVNGSTVYTGGAFETIGGASRRFIAALDADTGNATAWNPGPNQPVHTLALNGSTVYAGGLFISMGGQPRNHIAALDASTGQATAWDPNANDRVNTLLLNESTLYAGGDFTSIGGQSRSHIAALDTTTGLAIPSFDATADGEVYALALHDYYPALYVGGDFSNIGGSPTSGIAKLDASTGLTYPGWAPEFQIGVRALWYSPYAGGQLYVGGYFNTEYGAPRNFLATLDPDSGVLGSCDPNPDGVVMTLAEGVYVGGEFSTIGGEERTGLALIDCWNVNEWNPSPNGSVYSLALSNASPMGQLSTVYVGGSFGWIGGANRCCVAGLDAVTGNTISWDPALGSPATVYALAVTSNRLYVGGYFSTVGGQFHPYFAQFDGPTLVELQSFTARGSKNQVSLAWETGSELNNAGFHVWRTEAQKDRYIRLTKALIPAQGSTIMGAAYTYDDFDVAPGKSYLYKLEDIDTSGVSTFHGPVKASVGAIALVSPENGASVPVKKTPPRFAWESTPYDRFKLEFAADANFSGKVVTLAGPRVKGKGRWLRASSSTPTAAEWKRVKHMLSKGKTLYWRVTGKDPHGAVFTSEANVLKIELF